MSGKSLHKFVIFPILIFFSSLAFGNGEEVPEVQSFFTIDTPTYIVEENLLTLTINVANENGQKEQHVFEMHRMKNIYKTSPYSAKSTYRFMDKDGWIVTTVDEHTEHLRGVWFRGSRQNALQFGHSTQLRNLLKVSNRMLFENSYLATEVDMGEFCLNEKVDLRVESDNTNSPIRKLQSSQDGDPFVFYGGSSCFPGDDVTHALSIGIITDKALYDGIGIQVESLVEELVGIASSVYEYQFNVAIQVGSLLRYESFQDKTMPNAVMEVCDSDISKSLNSMQSFSKSLSAAAQESHWHLFTNCFPPSPGNPRGVAFVKTAGCSYSYYGINTGVSQYSATMWKTFAHEVGHAVGMSHTTEGIMISSGSGLIDGKPRFVSPGDTEACSVFSMLQTTNCRFFSPLGPTKEPTPKPTSEPTVRPTKQPTTAKPTNHPTARPTKAPTMKPTSRPTKQPTNRPTRKPTTPRPTKQPTTLRPTPFPTSYPTKKPTVSPTYRPTKMPTDRPTRNPTTLRPSRAPTLFPTRRPSNAPTSRPTRK